MGDVSPVDPLTGFAENLARDVGAQIEMQLSAAIEMVGRTHGCGIVLYPMETEPLHAPDGVATNTYRMVAFQRWEPDPTLPAGTVRYRAHG